MSNKKTTDFQAILLRSALSTHKGVRDSVSFLFEEMEEFVDPEVYSVVEECVLYHRATSSRLSAETHPKRAKLLDRVEDISDSGVPRWALGELRHAVKKNSFTSTLLKTVDILQVGSIVGKDKTPQKGLADALRFLRSNMPLAGNHNFESSNVDMVSDYDDFLHRQGTLQYGIPSLDDASGGIFKGELITFAAYAGQGKTTLLLNILYNLRVLQGKCGVYWSTESAPQPLLRRLLARHSRHPKFELQEGSYVTSRDLRTGGLSPERKAHYVNEIIPDWASDNYPPLFLNSIPRDSSLQDIMSLTEHINESYPISFVIIDYLSQLQPSTKVLGATERATRLFMEAKAEAISFNRGVGIPLIVAAQTNASSYAAALTNGYYNLRCVADTAEAERSSDNLFSVLATRNDVEDNVMKVGLLKVREGASGSSFYMDVDFLTSFVEESKVQDSGGGQSFDLSSVR